MKTKKLIAHTILDALELEVEFGKRLAIRTGWYKRSLKHIFKRAEMPISDELLNSLMEEEISDIENVLESLFLTMREAVDSGNLSAGLLHDLVMWIRHPRKGKRKAQEAVELTHDWFEYVSRAPDTVN
jgi:hypothetical protein